MYCLGKRKSAYCGIRLRSAVERGDSEIQIPSFATWSNSQNSLRLTIPRTELRDNNLVNFNYSVDGSNGKMHMWIFDKEIDVQKYGLSDKVIWIRFGLTLSLTLVKKSNCALDLKII